MKSYILAAGFESGCISIYDTNIQTLKHKFNAHSNLCTSIAFSPLNHLLLSSCGLDGKI